MGEGMSVRSELPSRQLIRTYLDNNVTEASPAINSVLAAYADGSLTQTEPPEDDSNIGTPFERSIVAAVESGELSDRDGLSILGHEGDW